MTDRNGHDDRSRSPVGSNGDDRDGDGDEDGNGNGDRNGNENENDDRNDGHASESDASRGTDRGSITPDTIPVDALDATTHQYDLEEGESVVDAVLSVVATLQGCEPLDLPPLYEAVDPNSLESVWNGSVRTGRSRAVWNTFVIDRTLVTVTSAGAIYAGVLEDAAQGRGQNRSQSQDHGHDHDQDRDSDRSQNRD